MKVFRCFGEAKGFKNPVTFNPHPGKVFCYYRRKVFMQYLQKEKVSFQKEWQ